jgi:Co/Zn/Cd efflux system component
MNQENEELNEIARKVAAHRFSGDENYSIDPFFIIAIAGLIINISRFIYECNRSKNKEDLFDEIKNPSVMYKLLLHRNIK